MAVPRRQTGRVVHPRVVGLNYKQLQLQLQLKVEVPYLSSTRVVALSVASPCGTSAVKKYVPGGSGRSGISDCHAVLPVQMYS